MNAVTIAQLSSMLIAGIACVNIKRTRHARIAAIAAMCLTAALMLAGTFIWPNPDATDHALIKLTTVIIGLMAVALTSLVNARPSTFARLLFLCAATLLFFSVSHPLALVFLWAMQSFIAWSELKHNDKTAGLSRLFAIYHVPSILLFFSGILLFRLQMPDVATWTILGAILIREGIVPVQTWFTAVMEKAPMGMVVMFAEPQAGIYALHELIPDAQFASIISFILPAFALTAVLCAALALAQTEARRSLAYLMLSQSSLVAFGFEQSSYIAETGSLLTWQVIGIATGGFAMTLAALQARKNHLSLITPNGNFAQTPKMATAFLVLGFASVGLPGTLGFIAEDLLVQGSVSDYPVIGFFLIIATAMNGITVMRMFFYLFCGQKTHAHEQDLIRRESFVLSFVVGLLFILGLAPQLILSLIAA